MGDLRNLFLEAKEQQITTLGSVYLQDYIWTGQETGGFCIVSDQRLYMKGIFYIKKGTRYRKSKEAKIIELPDVIKTKVVDVRRLGHREKMFEIICREGILALRAEEYRELEIQEFQKYLRMAKAYCVHQER